MNIPFDEPVELSPDQYTTKNLPKIPNQTPEELADTDRMEGAYKVSNLASLDRELAKAGPEQRKVLEVEKAKIAGIEDVPKDIPYDIPVSNPDTKLPGFTDTLRNPWDLWTKESIPARLISAHEKGVFDKPLGELVHSGTESLKEGVKNFSVAELVKAVKSNPGHFAGELVNSVVADPYLLLPVFWEALGGRLSAAGASVAGKAGQAVGRGVEVGITGAGVGGAASAAKQLDEEGFIDPHILANDMKVSAGLAAAISAVGSLASSFSKTKPQEIIDAAQFHMEEGDNIMTAMQKAMDVHDVPKDKAASLVDALKEQVEKEAGGGLEKDFRAMRKEIAPLVPKAAGAVEEAPSLAQMTKDLKVQREAGEISDSEFAKMTENLQAQEAARVAKENAPMPFGEEVAPDQAMEEAAAAKQRIQSGEATVGEEPSALAAREAMLNSKTTLSPSQMKELSDLRMYREVLPELGAAPEEAAAMTPSEAKRWIDARLPDAPLETFAKVEGKQALADSRGLGPAWKERGVYDPDMAKWVALGVGGAALGGYLSDDKGSGAAIGAALALGGPLAVKAGRKIIASGGEKLAQGKAAFAALKRDPHVAKQIDSMISAHEATTASISLASDRLSYAIKKLVPKAARREELVHVIQEGRVGELKGKERAAAEMYQKAMAEFGDHGQKAGVLDDLIGDGSYVTQLWKDETKAKGFFSAMKGSTRFAEDRLIPNYKEGIAAGLTPQTMDMAEIAQIYGRSLGKAIANKELLEVLKTTTVKGTEDLSGVREGMLKRASTRRERMDAEQLPRTTKPIMAIDKAPPDYVALNHPQLTGFRVNPDMAPSLSHLFYSTNIPAYLQAATAVSAAAKQGLLSLSGFHAKSLLEVGAGIALGLGSPKTLTKIPEMYRMLRNGPAGDFVEQTVKSGLKIDSHGFDMDVGAVEKLGNSIINGLEKVPLGKVASLPLKGVGKVATALNHFLWEYLHPAVKLATANVAYTKALEREAGKLAKDASYKALSPQQILREVSSTTNDLFGGLNWRQVAGEIDNHALHQLTASLTNPEGLRYLRVGLLAPDWLASTMRAGYKGGKSTLKGLIPGTKLSVGEDLYRRYFLGGALLTATVMETLQQHFTGTHFWDNKDPTSVTFADGRKIQVAKHFMEIFHWLREPLKTSVNKLGYLPKEAMNQILGVDYIAPHDTPLGRVAGPSMDDLSIPGRIGHAAKGVLPIGVQELVSGHEMEALSGALGAPIHGKSKLEREELSQQRRKLRLEIGRRQSRQQKRGY